MSLHLENFTGVNEIKKVSGDIFLKSYSGPTHLVDCEENFALRQFALP